MLAADAHCQTLARPASQLRSHLDQLAHALLIEHRKRSGFEDLRYFIRSESTVLCSGAQAPLALRQLLAVAVMAFAGAVRAGTITETLTGTISNTCWGGSCSSFSAPDPNGLFGGGNLYGDSVTLSLSYNPLTLSADATHNYGAQTNYSDDYYGDYVNDGAVTVGVTIGSTSYNVTNGNYGKVLNCYSPTQCGASPTPYELQVAARGGDTYPYLYIQFNGTTAIPADGTFTRSAVDTFTNAGTGGLIELCTDTQNCSGIEALYFTANPSSGTPEPGTWGLLAIGLGGVALIKRNRHASNI